MHFPLLAKNTGIWALCSALNPGIASLARCALRALTSRPHPRLSRLSHYSYASSQRDRSFLLFLTQGYPGDTELPPGRREEYTSAPEYHASSSLLAIVIYFKQTFILLWQLGTNIPQFPFGNRLLEHRDNRLCMRHSLRNVDPFAITDDLVKFGQRKWDALSCQPRQLELCEWRRKLRGQILCLSIC